MVMKEETRFLDPHKCKEGEQALSQALTMGHDCTALVQDSLDSSHVPKIT